ncbi:MAG: winged helix-turn-helix domain-containing protein [Oscillospiraceae bacterium]|nr:winged helix-turn-helix domain-containing protein [Oscillospiraceae bacterium]
MEKTGFHRSYVCSLIKRYFEDGLQSVIESHYGGNRRYMSFEEEADILEQFIQKAKQGQVVDIHEIEKAYCERVGHSIGHAQIYCVLHRHGWRKIMPRSKHPKKASEEVIETSKKLNRK